MKQIILAGCSATAAVLIFHGQAMARNVPVEIRVNPVQMCGEDLEDGAKDVFVVPDDAFLVIEDASVIAEIDGAAPVVIGAIETTVGDVVSTHIVGTPRSDALYSGVGRTMAIYAGPGTTVRFKLIVDGNPYDIDMCASGQLVSAKK